MSNPIIKQAIIVEGRDDSSAIKRAIDVLTIETHGYGIKESTWREIERVYKDRGIIIFTDPDYAGEQIRKRITARFPNAGHAYLSQKSATKNGDIGVENASPEAIINALINSHQPQENDNLTDEMQEVVQEKKEPYCYNIDTLREYALIGDNGAKERREKLGEILNIGYANAKGMARKLNEYMIPIEEFKRGIGKL